MDKIDKEILEILEQLRFDKLAVEKLNYLIKLQYDRIDKLLEKKHGKIKGCDYEFRKE